MSDVPAKNSDISLSAELQIERLCDEFEHALGRGPRPQIESFLRQIEPAHHAVALRELLMLEVDFLRHHELPVDPQDYLARFAAFANVVNAVLDELDFGLPHSRRSTRSFDLEQTDGPIEQVSDPELEEPAPGQFGRYEVRKKLGGGAFGRVYLAHDAQLQRLVAIKVPSRRLLGTGKSVGVFLEEARNACKLRHPRVVAVHDVQIENGQPYVVQDYVDGPNLADWMEAQTQSMPPEKVVAMLIDVAEAMAAAHAAGLVHRDLKPANILLDSECRPHVADFGLALHESVQRQHQGEITGTPAYMSPEQVRGESHRLDGRTDIWSLGVILYEMLVGRRPFHGNTRNELFTEIQERDPKPLSMVRPIAAIDAELERICLKCLQKRASDRYASASRLIEDLQHWLEARRRALAVPTAPPKLENVQRPLTTQIGDAARIVPKGLRSFDAEDADFFLDLLPGPRDRQGLPDSVRFWKSLIEQADSDETFPVGLIYGPSGCGKSSFVKAGLIPHLDHDRIVSICIEATPLGTEQRLQKAIEKHFSEEVRHPVFRRHKEVQRLPNGPTTSAFRERLTDTVRALREPGIRLPKVLLVIDQFEQWLYTHRRASSCALVNALRQCDGEQVQCILMVRDDFWMAISRFMNDLEVPILEGRNSAAVDLFDLPHARKVLMALGRVFDRLPQDLAQELSGEQSQFVDQAVTDLSEEGKVICVRLSLFADVMKGRPWTPAELKQVGGTKGVGVTFLEETFSAAHAPPQHRLHQEAARAVLAALLPNAGTEIKGHMRSREELIAAAGYEQRAKEFDQLLAILDGELRLITPTDPDAVEEDADDSDRHGGDTEGETYYQLTHDYLVPSLRELLTRKQKETRRGRAELQLTDRAALWNDKPETKFLPSVWEYLNLGALTDRAQWTASQRKMMGVAGRRYAIRTVTVAVFLAFGVWVGWWIKSRLQAQSLVEQLAVAKPSEVARIAERLQPHLAVTSHELERMIAQPAETVKQLQRQMHARVVLVGSDDTQVEPLVESLLTAQPAYVDVIRDALKPYQPAVAASLWDVLAADNEPASRRFRAALALADYDPDSDRWSPETTAFVARQLVNFNPEHHPTLREYLRPIRGRLLDDLEALFREADAAETQLVASASALADFIDEDELRLADLLVSGTPKQYAILWPRLVNSSNPNLMKFLDELVRKQPSQDLGSLDRVTLGRRRAGAAITRMRQGAREEILPIFEFTNDPEAMTHFIHRCKARGVRAVEILELATKVEQLSSIVPGFDRSTTRDKLTQQTDLDGPAAGEASDQGLTSLRTVEDNCSTMHARYALLLALGEFNLTDIPEADRESLIDRLANWYRHDPSSGIHGASGWLLRQWGYEDIVREVDQTPVPYSPDREWFTIAITVESPRRESPFPSPDVASESTDSARDDSSGDNGAGDHANDATSEPAEEGQAGRPKNSQSSAAATAADDSGRKQSETQTEYVPQTFYFTFIVFPAGDYQIGSLADELDQSVDETRHGVKITRPFGLSDRELTFAELIAFDRHYQGFMQQYEHNPEDAAYGADWYNAVAFCRWLTEQAGLADEDQAYPAPNSLDKENFPREADPTSNWAPRDWPIRLERPGFRLPTEAEWEVACRVGTRTSYGQGTDVALLRHYAWYEENSEEHVHPPKTRRPGLRGTFDMHGNLWEWCHDWFGSYGSETAANGTGPEAGSVRVDRGGGWNTDASHCRSSHRDSSHPVFRLDSLGVRLALVPSAKNAEHQADLEERRPVGSAAEPAADGS